MENQISPGSVLTWGIVALCLCTSPILGLIFALVANGKAKAFKIANGSLFGTAKVGNIFAKIALPVSIIMQAYYVLIFVIALAG